MPHILRFTVRSLCLIAVLLGFGGQAFGQQTPYFASGIKVGEATQDSAIVWVRLSQRAEADFDRLPILTEGLPGNQRLKIMMPEDIVPGATGFVRVHYRSESDENERVTPWVRVDQKNDFIHQFRLQNLTPGTEYRVVVEAVGTKEAAADNAQLGADSATIDGRFKTAPAAENSTPVRFIVSTCQAVRSIDAGKQGHETYRWMLAEKPDFFVHTGDILYYDKVPLCQTAAAARSKWSLMFAYGHNRRFHRNVTSYFMKDDHDTLKNDCWPGQKYGQLTFDQGLDIFRQQVCMGEQTYRTIRWGAGCANLDD